MAAFVNIFFCRYLLYADLDIDTSIYIIRGIDIWLTWKPQSVICHIYGRNFNCLKYLFSAKVTFFFSLYKKKKERKEKKKKKKKKENVLHETIVYEALISRN